VGAKCIAMTMDCEWAISFSGEGVVIRYRTTALLSDEAICYTLVVVILCSLY